MDPTIDDELGRTLFEKRPHPLAMVVPAVAAPLFLLVGVVSLASLTNGIQRDAEDRMDSLGIGLFGCVGSVALVFAAIAGWKTVVRVHQYGVSRTTPFGRTTVHYDRIDSLAFSVTRDYINGIYVGTRYYCQFGFGSKSMFFNISFKKDTDNELEDLRDYVSEKIAAGLSKQLDTQGEAPWTPRLRFVRDGVEYLDKKQWRLLPFRAVGKCEIDQGIFYLRELDSEFPIMRENTLMPNFFPGLVVFIERTSTDVDGVP